MAKKQSNKSNGTGPTDYPGYHACTLVAGCNNLVALGDLGCSACLSKVVHGIAVIPYAFRRKTGPWTTARGTLISCGHSTYHKLLPLTWWGLGKWEV